MWESSARRQWLNQEVHNSSEEEQLPEKSQKGQRETPGNAMSEGQVKKAVPGEEGEEGSLQGCTQREVRQRW